MAVSFGPLVFHHCFFQADVKLTKEMRMRAKYLGEKGELCKNLADFLE